MKPTRLDYVLAHAIPSLLGVCRHPEPRLILERARMAFTRKFTPFRVRDGLFIEHNNQLLAYWDLKVEADLFKHWPATLPDNPVILDVGANCGVFGWLCRKRWPAARIIGFEPYPEMFEMSRALRAYDELHNVALSDREGTATLFLNICHGMSANIGGSEIVTYDSAKTEVPTKRLDAIYPDLAADCIKVDVDGSELLVIAGGIDAFQRSRHSVIECHGSKRVKEVSDRIGRKACRVSGNDFLFSKT